MPKGCRDPKGAFEGRTLVAAAAVVATGNSQSSPVRLPVAPAIGLECDLTAAAAAGGDTLDVFVQTRLDGTNWVDVCHFTQALGNGAAKRFFAKLTPAAIAEAMFENASALAAGSVRNLAGDEWAVRWVVAGATPNFTFSVYAVPM